MKHSREFVLGRIRERLGRTAGNASSAGAVVDAALAARAPGPRPPPDDDLIAAFRARSEALASTVAEVPRMDDVPCAVAAYLAEHDLGMHAVCVPDLATIDWNSGGLDVSVRGAADGDMVGITGCFRAIAETGTLMLCSGPGTPATVSLLPETHVAVVEASSIVASMDDAWAALREEHGQIPRAVNFISGPSRTGDIEQTIVLGAHGPYRVHIVIVSD